MRVSGLASGIDTEQIIKDLMKAERIPLDKLFQKREWVDWQRDAYRDVNLSLSAFRDSMSNLKLQSSFIAYGVTSSNEGVATGTSTADAVPGTYDVEVLNVAKVATVNSANAIMVGGVQATSSTKVLAAGQTETITIQNGAGLEATITVDDTDTFDSVASKIAQATDDTTGESLGFRANFDDTTGRFFFSTKDMGVSQSINFVENANGFIKSTILNDTALSGTSGDIYSYAGEDGSLTFDGIQVDGLTSNQTTVNGININLLDIGTTTLTVTSDTESVFNGIKDFVDSYNELIADLEKKLDEPRYRDYPPLTEEQREGLSENEAKLWDEKAKSGLLRSDSIVSSVLTDLRRSLYDPVEGINAGELDRLAGIGITTGMYSEGGKLNIDEDKLKAAIRDNPDEVMNVFTKSAEVEGNHSQMGLAKRVYEDLNNSIDRLKDKAGRSGVTLADQSVLGKNLHRLDDEIISWEERLGDIENRYFRQFTAMERAISRLNQQSAFLSQSMFSAGG